MEEKRISFRVIGPIMKNYEENKKKMKSISKVKSLRNWRNSLLTLSIIISLISLIWMIYSELEPKSKISKSNLKIKLLILKSWGKKFTN